MGVATILSAKKVYLLAWGEEKAKMVKECVEAKNISGTVADEYNSEKTDSSATNSDAWVKTGSTWPLGIYNALKYRDFDSVANRSNQR